MKKKTIIEQLSEIEDIIDNISPEELAELFDEANIPEEQSKNYSLLESFLLNDNNFESTSYERDEDLFTASFASNNDYALAA